VIVFADDIEPVPWQNGGGRTRELLRWPAEGEWRLRLSLADIEADGPFSAFPGVQRWFVVVRGEGVALDLDGNQRQVRPGDAPISFDGVLAPGCRLLGGPTRDLNLMLRRLDGRLLAASPGDAPPHAARLGFFDADRLRLHWPFAAVTAPGTGWWIAVEAE
jgi:uncharacterized protein